MLHILGSKTRLMSTIILNANATIRQLTRLWTAQEHFEQIGSWRSTVYEIQKLFFLRSTQSQVLYDGECPICVKEIQFLQYLQRNRPGKVDFVDISLQCFDEEKYGGISYEMAMDEMHVIDENNKVNSLSWNHTANMHSQHLAWQEWLCCLSFVCWTKI